MESRWKLLLAEQLQPQQEEELDWFDWLIDGDPYETTAAAGVALGLALLSICLRDAALQHVVQRSQLACIVCAAATDARPRGRILTHTTSGPLEPQQVFLLFDSQVRGALYMQEAVDFRATPA